MTAEKLYLHSVRSTPDVAELLLHYRKQMKDEAYLYLERRGISEETAEQFRIGYSPGKIGFYVENSPVGDYFDHRIIIPVIDAAGTPVDLLGRSLDDHREPKYKALFGMDDVLFNEEALLEAEDVVLCNGVFDVLTLAQARIPAVCVPGYQPFKEKHAWKLKEKRVFICLGNDELGRRESGRIESILREHAKEIYIVQLPEAVKDINDLFVRAQNPMDAFVQLINRTMEETLLIPLAPDYKNATVYMEEYLKRSRGQVSSIRTGLAKLDEALFGGLDSSLYVLGGPGSSGKSMLMKQMADHIAEQQIPVVFISWDMTGFELWARSIARLLAVEPQHVLGGKIEAERIAEANKLYAGYSRMLWTVECSLETTLDRVESSVERIAGISGRMPVVFIDHLQRIPLSSVNTGAIPANPAQHQAIVAYKLKMWSREWNTPVVVAAPLDTGGLAESVTASADVVMLLKPRSASDADEAANGGGLPVLLELAKNRNGPLSRINLTFCNQKAVFTD